MGRPSNDARLAAKHAFFRSDFDKIQAAVRDVRVQCLSDRRFYSIPGAQWEGPVGDQFENKPRFEFNKTHLAVLRVVNEYRNNRITVDFVPKDGSDADELADTCDGLFRADEQDSGAQEAYDNAFEEGTSGGMGAIRLRARYENEDDDEDDRQRIAIEPIYEADTCVFFSLDGKKFDKSDAKRCYLLSSMSPGDYEAEWKDSPTSWPKDISQAQFDWCTPEVVWIAEVYEVEEQSELVHFFRGLALGDGEPDEMEVSDQELKDDPAKQPELEARGFRKVREKRRKVRKIHKYIMNGARILSDEGYIAGTCIPVIPYYGKRWFVDGIERCQGHVRLARDAQVLDNMIKSWLAEMASRFDIEKPIVTPEMIGEHATMWARDSIEKYPYLLLNPITDPITQQQTIPPLQYTKAPNMPPAMAALAQLAATALEDMLGNQQAGEQLQPNQSGKAVELIQQRLDMQVFIYVDNFRKTVKRLGEVWLSMARELLVEPGRKLKALNPDGEAAGVELMKPMINKETHEQYMANDLSNAKFDVGVDVGPSSSSRRAATVRALTSMLQMTVDPEAQGVLTAMAMMNMEGEGLSELKPFWRRKLLNAGAVKPTDDEQKQMDEAAQNQQPGPQDQYLQAAAQNQLADAAKKQADTLLTHAKVDQTNADIVNKMAGVDLAAASHALAVVQHVDGQALAREQAARQQAQAAQQAAPEQAVPPLE
jgi:hypothetical protein